LGLSAATLGRVDDAERHFAGAIALHERVDAPVWLARTELAWAEMLSGERAPATAERARALADQALRRAVELGSAGVERRARELLARL
jgi:hypothetical protein